MKTYEDALAAIKGYEDEQRKRFPMAAEIRAASELPRQSM
jgi:hypothetical protein